MKIHWALGVSVLAVCAAFALSAGAQDNGLMYDFELLNFDADRLESDLSGWPERLSGNVHIWVEPEDPDQEPLHIWADEVRFVGEGAQDQLRVVLERDVRVEFAQRGMSVTVTAGEGEIDMARSVVVFTGDPVVVSDMGEMSGPRIELDMETGRLRADQPRVRNLRLSQMRNAGERAPAPDRGPVLQSGDVQDWEGLLTAIQAAAEDDSPSPARRIHDALRPEARQYLAALSPDALTADMRAGILDEFNRVLREPDLYDEQSWEGVALPSEAEALLEPLRADLSAADVVRLNRLLLHAAFPNALAPPS